MKKISFLLSLLLSFSFIHAQYWQIPNANAGTNPGGLNNDAEYPVGGGLDATWATIQAFSATPVWSPNQTLPFAFNFNGAAVTQFKVSTSGILTFDIGTGLAAPSYTKAALPDATIPDKSVCIWGMGALGSNDNIVKKTFGTSPNRQQWIQFSSYGYGTNISDGSNFTYWSIVMEESSNKIYLVDNRTGGYPATNQVSAGIQVNSTTAYSVATSPNLNFLAGADPSPLDNSFYTFNPGTQPPFDMSVSEITTPAYLAMGNTSIMGKIINYGTTTITSITINYKIDGGATVSSVLSSLNIPSLSAYTFTSPTQWNAIVGAHVIDVWATNLNGSNPDANPADDHKTKTVSVLSENVQRIPLLEVFTSSTCSPCTPGNINFHSIVDSKPANEYVAIKYQQDFPGVGDPYRTTESVNRRTTPYAINSIPRMEIDGFWDGNASSFTGILYDAARAIPAQYKMDGTFNVNNMTVSAKVKFSPLFNTTGAKLYVAILERKTVQNVKTNGETEFFQVMKKMLPTETGTTMPMVAIGSWDSISFNYTFKGNYRLPIDGQTGNIINHATEHSVEHFYNTNVVAWIQAADKTVYQAINLTSLTPTSIEDFSTTINTIDVYPNPSTDLINVSMDLKSNDEILATLIDVKGNVIESKSVNMQAGKNNLQFNTSALATGTYHLMLFDSKNNSSVHKIQVQH